MNQEKIELAKREIEKIIEKSEVFEDPMHSKLTCKWLLKLDPQVDEPMQIAALGHDIERAVNWKKDDKNDLSNYDQDKKIHALRSKEMIGQILKKLEFDQNFIEKAEHLIEGHEVGGDKETDLLKSADSIAYFDFNINPYFERNGEAKTRFKIKFMFDRIHDSKVKEIILDLKYQPEIQRLIDEELRDK